MRDLTYQAGFGNHFETEKTEGCLPKGQNNPQKSPHGLYAEQVSGSAFTAPREQNLRTWQYRIRPSVVHSGIFDKTQDGLIRSAPLDETLAPPTQLRWNPLPAPKEKKDFLDGLITFAVTGSALDQRGFAVHLYHFNQSMTERFFYNADGELIFVPESGELLLYTEFGILAVQSGEIGVIPRGTRFQVRIKDAHARGYVGENYGAPFRLPNLGPIGSNGLANPQDFQAPVAWYEDRKGPFELIAKFQGFLWSTKIPYSPLDVVAWRGNLTPYKYDLGVFNTIGTVSHDHPDPSIFTVLTSPSEIPGTANADFVIFPPRWMVAENTFRPPYFHRNLMSEFMGLITGAYDAKQDGFLPGGASLHNCMSAHGPDAATFESASHAELKPVKISKTMAFMFESKTAFIPTQFALQTELLQTDYLDCWKDLKSHYRK